MDINYVTIGKRIRQFRISRKWTQKDLSDKIDSSPSHMSHIEKGGTKLSLPTLMKIANALGATSDQLLGENIHTPTPVFKKEIENILCDCDNYELQSMIDTMTLVKQYLRNKPDYELSEK